MSKLKDNLSVLTPRLFSLLTAMFLLQLGTAITNLALPILILQRYGLTGELGVALAFRLLPMVIAGGAAAWAMQRFDARVIAVGGTVLTGIFTAIMPLTTAFWQINLVSMASGLAGVFATPALMALRTGVIPRDRAVQGNGLVVAAERSPQLIGPAVVVAVLVFWPVSALLLSEAIATCVAGLLIIGLPKVPRKLEDEDEVKISLLTIVNLPRLWKLAGGTRRTQGYLVTGFFYTAAVSAGRLILAALAATAFVDNPSAFAWLLGSMAVGAVLGGLGSTLMSKWKLGKIYLLGNVLEAVVWVFVAMGQPFVVTCGLLLLAGVLESVATTVFFADIQLRLTPAAVGRLFAIFIPVTGAAAVVGSLLGSIIMPSGAIWIGGLVVALLIAVPFLPYFATYWKEDKAAEEKILVSE